MLAAIHRGSRSRSRGRLPAHSSRCTATVKASERTGSMREGLGPLPRLPGRLELVRKKIISRHLSAILMIVGSLVIGFSCSSVVPRFAKVYEDMAGTLPLFLPAAARFGIRSANHAACWLSCWPRRCGSVGVFRARTFPRLLTSTLAHPGPRRRMKAYQLARLYRTAGMLLRAGNPAVRALDMVRELPRFIWARASCAPRR